MSLLNPLHISYKGAVRDSTMLKCDQYIQCVRYQTYNLLVGKHIVDFAQPVQTGVIAARCKGVEIRDNVVTLHDGIQQLYQVQQGLKLHEKCEGETVFR